MHLFKKNKVKSKSIMSFLMSSVIPINDEDKKREKLFWIIRKESIPIPNLDLREVFIDFKIFLDRLEM